MSKRKRVVGRMAEVMRPSGLSRVNVGRIGGEVAPRVAPHGNVLVRDKRRGMIVLGRSKQEPPPDRIA